MEEIHKEAPKTLEQLVDDARDKARELRELLDGITFKKPLTEADLDAYKRKSSVALTSLIHTITKIDSSR